MNKKILILWFSCLLFDSHAQISFDSTTLKDLYDRLPQTERNIILEIQNRNRDNSIDTLIKYNGKYLIISFSNGKLNQLGIELRDLHQLSLYDSVVRIFIERAFLRLSCDNTIPDIVNTSHSNQIRFLVQDQELFFTQISSFAEFYALIESAKQFKLSKNENIFIVEWINDLSDLKMIFPNNYQLIVGKNKKELDEELLRRIGVHDNDEEEPISENIIYPVTDTLPIVKLKGSGYMNILSSESYYKLNGIDSILIFERGLIRYSVNNLFLHKELMGSRRLKVNHNLYGARSFPYTISLERFFDYFSPDFECFVGLEKDEPDLIECTLVFHHKYFNFIHMLHFKTNSDELFNPYGTLSADFYSNIPMHNVSDLYMKYVPDESDIKIQINLQNP